MQETIFDDKREVYRFVLKGVRPLSKAVLGMPYQSRLRGPAKLLGRRGIELVESYRSYLIVSKASPLQLMDFKLLHAAPDYELARCRK